MIHFIGEEAVRQIEKYPGKTVYLSNATPICGESILYDQGFQLIKPSLSEKDYITKDDFEKMWRRIGDSQGDHGVGSNDHFSR